MEKKNDFAEKLIRANGIAQEVDHLVKNIQHLIIKERTRLRQMKWVTAGLWLGALIALGLQVPSSKRLLVSGEPVTAIKLYLSIAASWLPILATVASIILIFRWRSFSTTEIKLRLSAIEAMMLKRECESKDKK